MQLDRLEPFTRRWIKAQQAAGGPALVDLSVDEARQLMRDNQVNSQENLESRRQGLHHSQYQTPVCRVHLLKPKQAEVPLPVLLYLHEGGWVLGDWTTHERLMIDLVRLTGAAVVFPEYGLSPETKFPGAIEQCYAVATWIVENSASLALDASRFAIAGDSAGGGLAAVVAMLAGQRGGPAFRTQMLFYPVVDCDFNTASYLEFGTGFNLDTPVMEWFWAHYIPEDAKRIEPFASPLRSSLEELQLAPPALVLTAECDVLRDEGEAYARKLADAGVQTAGYRCLGTVHSFLLANGLAESATARVAMQLVAAHLRAAFA